MSKPGHNMLALAKVKKAYAPFDSLRAAAESLPVDMQMPGMPAVEIEAGTLVPAHFNLCRFLCQALIQVAPGPCLEEGG